MKEAVTIASRFNASVTAMHVLPSLPRTFLYALDPYRKHLKKETEVFMEEAKNL